MRRYAILAFTALVLIAAALPALGDQTTPNPAVWTGNGSENLPCNGTLLWIFTGPGAPTLMLNGTAYAGAQQGQGNGSYHYETPGAGVTVNSSASVAWSGDQGNYVLTISHCTPSGSTTTSSTTTSSTTTTGSTTTTTEATTTTQATTTQPTVDATIATSTTVVEATTTAAVPTTTAVVTPEKAPELPFTGFDPAWLMAAVVVLSTSGLYLIRRSSKV